MERPPTEAEKARAREIVADACENRSIKQINAFVKEDYERLAVTFASALASSRLSGRNAALHQVLEVAEHGSLDMVKGFIQAQLGMTRPWSEVRKEVKTR